MQMYALDRSLRSFDPDGHLRVASSVISAAQINPYYGREIPNYDRLGLDADRVYQLFRDPQELAKGAATFDGKPLLSVHRPQPAKDFNRGIVVGAVQNPAWREPALRATIVVWDAGAIAGIETGDQRALSAAYSYRADMTPGRWQGKAYDGVMRDISGNHVALVTEGRVAGAIVGDAKLSQRRFIVMDENDPIERVCEILKQEDYDADDIAQIRDFLGKRSPQRTKEIAQDAARRSAEYASYKERFPDGLRLGGC